MKTINYPQNKETREIEVLYAVAMPSGYGHKKITVDVMYNGARKSFSATTNNMPGYDAATELDGHDKYEALYDLIDSDVEEQIAEWMYHEEL